MLSFHQNAARREAATAQRALELFLQVHNLAWNDAYQLAVYEQSAAPWRFEQAVKQIADGATITQAIGSDLGGNPIEKRVEDRAWHTRS